MKPEPPLPEVKLPAVELAIAGLPKRISELAGVVSSQLPVGAGAVISLTSVERLAGRTTTAILLFEALSHRLTENVLLIDGDFTNPELSRRCGLASASGLREVLAGSSEIFRVIRPLNRPRMSVLPAGMPTTPLDARTLADRMAAPFSLLGGGKWVCVLDGPPLFDPFCAGLVRASHVTYILVPLGRSAADGVHSAVQSLFHMGARPAGCIATSARRAG
jgi:Mrp family chromosome partitioning ATPase